MSDRRETPRRRVFLGARIVPGPLIPDIACHVRDTGLGGARLRIAGASIPPDLFDLAVDCRGRVLRACVTWRRGEEIGVRFLAERASGSAEAGTIDALRQRLAASEAEVTRLRARLAATEAPQAAVLH